MRIESLKILYDNVIENSLSVFEIIKQIRDLIGTRIVLIEVNNEPKLIKLYESLGFECIGIQDDLTQLYKFDLTTQVITTQI